MFGKKHQVANKEAEVDLNRVVTPMLDMTFQILFFLIMNFRLPSPEGQLDLLMPKEDEGAPSIPQEDKLDKPETDEYLLRVTLFERGGNEGEMQGTMVELSWRKKGEKIEAAEPVARIDPGDRNEKDDYFRNLNSLMYGLVVKLKQYQPKEGGKQPTIKIECPNKLKYSEMLKVMDVMRKMKFQNVGVVPVPKG
jgi:biopolymer transport protein ExbD